MTLDQLVDIVSQGIAWENGFFKQGGKVPPVSVRLCNPGCLEQSSPKPYWKDSQGNPLPEVNGLVEFDCNDDGWRALRAQCRFLVAKRELTFYEIFAGRPGVYRGLNPMRPDNVTNPMAYATKVVQFFNRKTGLEADVSSIVLEFAK